MSAIVLDGQQASAPDSMRVRTFVEDPSLAFSGSKRRKTVSELIVHETVTRDVSTTLRVLRRRRLGAHFIIAPDGEVLQAADPVTTRLEHAAPHNAASIGIEIVNPVEPRFLRPKLPWKRTVKATWAVGGSYVLPTPEQAETCAALIDTLTAVPGHGIAIPRSWRGLQGSRLVMGRVSGSRAPRPGVYAHSYFHHADGAWPVLYAWLRLEARLSPEAAFERATELASGNVRHVELGSFLNDLGPKEERWTLKSPQS